MIDFDKIEDLSFMIRDDEDKKIKKVRKNGKKIRKCGKFTKKSK